MASDTTCGGTSVGAVANWQYTSARKPAQPGTAGKKEAPGEKFMETSATTLHEKPAIFTVRQLSPALGAEIAGVDLRDPIDDALEQKLLDAWHQHLVILLRNQTLD